MFFSNKVGLAFIAGLFSVSGFAQPYFGSYDIEYTGKSKLPVTDGFLVQAGEGYAPEYLVPEIDGSGARLLQITHGSSLDIKVDKSYLESIGAKKEDLILYYSYANNPGKLIEEYPKHVNDRGGEYSATKFRIHVPKGYK